MAAIRHLSHAPLVEALIDFRAVPAPSFSVGEFAALRPRLPDFPSMEEMRRFEAQIEFRGDKAPTGQLDTSGLLGYRFMSGDGREAVQYRSDGFTFNRLAPYTSWNEIRPKALRLWNLFVEIAKPEQVDRLALRYINRIEVPAKGTLEALLAVVPPRYPGAPGTLANFVFRTAWADSAARIAANVALALQPLPSGEASNLVIDIDVYKEGPHPLDIAQLEPIFDQLRDMKNEIFFGSITENLAAKLE
jgi:uncharacterized protein (TIGR04255 family)